jgi:hypothetical protein
MGSHDSNNDRFIDISVMVSMVVTIWSTLIFHGCGIGKGKGFVVSFQLDTENLGSLPLGWIL